MYYNEQHKISIIFKLKGKRWTELPGVYIEEKKYKISVFFPWNTNNKNTSWTATTWNKYIIKKKLCYKPQFFIVHQRAMNDGRKKDDIFFFRGKFSFSLFCGFSWSCCEFEWRSILNGESIIRVTIVLWDLKLWRRSLESGQS